MSARFSQSPPCDGAMPSPGFGRTGSTRQGVARCTLTSLQSRPRGVTAHSSETAGLCLWLWRWDGTHGKPRPAQVSIGPCELLPGSPVASDGQHTSPDPPNLASGLPSQQMAPWPLAPACVMGSSVLMAPRLRPLPPVRSRTVPGAAWGFRWRWDQVPPSQGPLGRGAGPPGSRAFPSEPGKGRVPPSGPLQRPPH